MYNLNLYQLFIILFVALGLIIISLGWLCLKGSEIVSYLETISDNLKKIKQINEQNKQE